MSKLEMRNLTDAEIIESVKKGNQTDYAILVDRYKNKAFSLLKRMLKNDFDAEEVLQDCFLKAYNGLENFKFESSFSTWFYRIAYNTAVSRLSLKKRKIENDMASIDDQIHLSYSDNSADVEQEELSVVLSRLIEKLPANYAAVINLFYMNQLSCEEISEIMQISVANVKVMLYRSRNSLKEIILKNNLTRELL